MYTSRTANFVGGRPSFDLATTDQPFLPIERSGFAWILLFLFVANIMLSIALVRWQIASIPVRSVFALACLGLVALFRFELIVSALKNHRIKFIVIGLVAAFGMISSLLVKEELAVTFRQVLEIHFQSFVALLLGATMISIWGVRRITFLLIGCVGISAAVALIQFVDLSPGWGIRAILGEIQGDLPSTQRWYTRHFRALGLSYSPVIFATQVCLAFIAYWAYRIHETRGRLIKQFDFNIIVAVLLLFTLSIASGNRSPILGIVVFSAVYFMTRGHKMFLLFVAGGLLLAPLAFYFLGNLDNAGLRVASVDDGSAVGRITLATYGFRLFLEQPMGYGLGFDPRAHWPVHWEYLQHLPNVESIRQYGLHNFFLNSLNKYGVLIVFVGIFTMFYVLIRWRVLLPFVIYVIHIFFHNDGPLQSDILIWYILPLLPLGYSGKRVETDGQNTVTPGVSV